MFMGNFYGWPHLLILTSEFFEFSKNIVIFFQNSILVWDFTEATIIIFIQLKW